MLPAVLGTGNVEILTTNKWPTAGSRAWKPANVSPRLTAVHFVGICMLDSDSQSVCFVRVFERTTIIQH